MPNFEQIPTPNTSEEDSDIRERIKLFYSIDNENALSEQVEAYKKIMQLPEDAKLFAEKMIGPRYEDLSPIDALKAALENMKKAS
ncbi:MAG: hypothetical protein PHZ07_02330 [Patescibacteria group bacterium]|nr:hypothetical protein [Patescibacteria group bacterium]MDD4304238.1 hypothetical protein [Patescibacteria group bacterium]MDD4695292.1 hypothetical protein [Patescibacteria group bacterium]